MRTHNLERVLPAMPFQRLSIPIELLLQLYLPNITQYIVVKHNSQAYNQKWLAVDNKWHPSYSICKMLVMCKLIDILMILSITDILRESVKSNAN